VWSRDLAIVGAATSFGATFGIEHQVKVDMLVAAGVGGLVGALFGVAFRRLLLARLYQPIGAWIPVSLALGALFGVTVALVTPLLMRESFGDHYFLCALFGGTAGALQLSWFWLPYAVRAGRGKSTWPVVLAAVVIANAIGWAALAVLLAILRPQFN
jgi:hypothetical protein